MTATAVSRLGSIFTEAAAFAHPAAWHATAKLIRELAFGTGPHFCLGAHLARMEVRSIFRELLDRVEDIELVSEPSWIKAYFVQGPKSIPISYRMR